MRRLCEQKLLEVRGDAALIEGTEAARLHPEYVEESDDVDENEDDPEEDEAEDGTELSEGDGEGEGVKRGATLKLLRRLEPGEFYFKPGWARK